MILMRPRSASVAVAGSPFWSEVKFLAGFEGVDGSTTATDSSSSAHSLSFVGSAQIDTARMKFGASSLSFPSTGSGVLVPSSSDFHFSNQPFTVEGWFYFSSFSDAYVIGVYDTSSQRSWVVRCSTSGPSFTLSTTGGPTSDATAAAGGLTTGRWYHIAIDRDVSSVVRVYTDGSMVAKKTMNLSIHPSTGKLSIGGYTTSGSLAGGYFVGHVDEVRITKGLAVYASDDGFAPPSAPFPRS